MATMAVDPVFVDSNVIINWGRGPGAGRPATGTGSAPDQPADPPRVPRRPVASPSVHARAGRGGPGGGRGPLPLAIPRPGPAPDLQRGRFRPVRGAHHRLIPLIRSDRPAPARTIGTTRRAGGNRPDGLIWPRAVPKR